MSSGEIVVRFTPLCGFKNEASGDGGKLVKFTSVATPVTLRFGTRAALETSVELLRFLLHGVPGVSPMRTLDRDAMIGHLLERLVVLSSSTST